MVVNWSAGVISRNIICWIEIWGSFAIAAWVRSGVGSCACWVGSCVVGCGVGGAGSVCGVGSCGVGSCVCGGICGGVGRGDYGDEWLQGDRAYNDSSSSCTISILLDLQ